MKTLKLDYNTWRCGGSIGKNVLGKGQVALLNDEGYMCCLGQFSLQLNKTIKKEDMRSYSSPISLNKSIELLTEQQPYGRINSTLSSNAMGINDNPHTTPEEKIKALKKLFTKEGYKISVINKPK